MFYKSDKAPTSRFLLMAMLPFYSHLPPQKLIQTAKKAIRLLKIGIKLKLYFLIKKLLQALS